MAMVPDGGNLGGTTAIRHSRARNHHTRTLNAVGSHQSFPLPSIKLKRVPPPCVAVVGTLSFRWLSHGLGLGVSELQPLGLIADASVPRQRVLVPCAGEFRFYTLLAERFSCRWWW